MIAAGVTLREAGARTKAARSVLSRRLVRWTLMSVSAALLCGAAAAQQDLRSLVYQAPPGGYLGLEGEVTIYDRSHAVVIGISDYQEFPDLPGAARDARAVADVLAKHRFQVTLLLDDQASRSAIARVLGDEMPQHVQANDRVLVYFAGHGITAGSVQAPMGYLMPVDGSNTNRISTGISMREVQAWFSAYPSKHVLFLADACYSGLALTTRSTGIPPTLRDYLLQVTEKPVRVAVTAGRSDQEAHEWRGHGLFTFFLLEGLQGAADSNQDRILTSSELYAYLEPNVAQTALSNWRARQNPQIGRSGQGEFVFLLDGRPSAPATVREATPQGEAMGPRPDRRSVEVEPDRRSPAAPPQVLEGASGTVLKLPDYGDGVFANFSDVLVPSTDLRQVEVLLRGADAEIRPDSVRLEFNGHAVATFSAINPLPRGVRVIFRLDKVLRPGIRMQPAGPNLVEFEAQDERLNVYEARFALTVDEGLSFPVLGGRLERTDPGSTAASDGAPRIAWLHAPAETGDREILVKFDVGDGAGLRRVVVEVNGKDLEEIVLQNGLPFRKRGGFRSSHALPGRVSGDGNQLSIEIPLKLRKGFNVISVRAENVLGLRSADQVTVKRSN